MKGVNKKDKSLPIYRSSLTGPWLCHYQVKRRQWSIYSWHCSVTIVTNLKFLQIKLHLKTVFGRLLSSTGYQIDNDQNGERENLPLMPITPGRYCSHWNLFDNHYGVSFHLFALHLSSRYRRGNISLDCRPFFSFSYPTSRPVSP